MSRVRMLAVITAVASLVFASVALGAKVTGGTTTVTASSSAVQALSANHIMVTPIAPASASGATFTFPILTGKVNAKTLRGVIVHRGGLMLSNGTKSFKLLHPTIVSRKSGVSLLALARVQARRCHLTGPRHHRLRCLFLFREKLVRIGRVSDISQSNGSVSGTVTITQFTAAALNRLAGKKAFAAGNVLGTATTTPTLKH
jgi:hypothetical protein